MASRRKLKKTIQFVSSELITDLYFQCLMSKNLDEKKVDELVLQITSLSNEFTARANRPDGKKNPPLVKAYFRSLYADWQKAMGKVVEQMATL